MKILDILKQEFMENTIGGYLWFVICILACLSPEEGDRQYSDQSLHKITEQASLPLILNNSKKNWSSLSAFLSW